MAREIWVYPAKGPKYLLRGRKTSREDLGMLKPFEQRVRESLYALECEQGSRFRIPDYDTKTLKKVWCD